MAIAPPILHSSKPANLRFDYYVMRPFFSPWLLRSFPLLVLLSSLAGCGGKVIPGASASDNGNHSQLERQIFNETNRLRANPAGYAQVFETILGRVNNNLYYPEGSDIGIRLKEGVPAIKEAISVIRQKKSLPELKWSEELAEAARAHIRDTAPKGLLGHKSSSGGGFAERIGEVMQAGRFVSAAENLSYGYSDGRDVVAQLFIDDGVPNRGHRKNLLNQQLNHIGVACGNHPKYNPVCVAIYAYR